MGLGGRASKRRVGNIRCRCHGRAEHGPREHRRRCRVHGALPRIVEIKDETDPTWAAPGEVTLRAAVVFGTGDGWTRPGLRLVVGFQVVDGKVTAVFIDDGYVVSDPELLP